MSEKFQLVLDVAQKAQVHLQLTAYIFSDFYFNKNLSLHLHYLSRIWTHFTVSPDFGKKKSAIMYAFLYTTKIFV